MPSDFAWLDVNFPGRDASSAEIVNYLYMLMEQLRYTLGSLGARNFSEQGLSELTEPIYASITESARGLETRISASAGEVLSAVSSQYETKENAALISQQADENAAKISLVVSVSGGENQVNAAGIVAAINDSGSSVAISADKVDIEGVVTFSDLEDTGKDTVINADYITTGTISADRIDSNISHVADTLYVGDWQNDDVAHNVIFSSAAGIGVDAGSVDLEMDAMGSITLTPGSGESVKIFVGSAGSYWEITSGGIYWKNSSGTVLRTVTLS